MLSAIWMILFSIVETSFVVCRVIVVMVIFYNSLVRKYRKQDFYFHSPFINTNIYGIMPICD